MSLEQVACEDLKAFERRLTEIISSAHPSAIRWRILLLVTSLCVAVGAVYWLGDPDTAEVPFFASLMNHPFFSLSSLGIGNNRIIRFLRKFDNQLEGRGKRTIARHKHFLSITVVLLLCGAL